MRDPKNVKLISLFILINGHTLYNPLKQYFFAKVHRFIRPTI